MEKDSDYSKSFRWSLLSTHSNTASLVSLSPLLTRSLMYLSSGSAADTKNEREAAALMKGESGTGGVGDEDDDNVYLKKPQYDTAYEQFEKQYLANVSEAWKKFLGIANSLTHSLTHSFINSLTHSLTHGSNYIYTLIRKFTLSLIKEPVIAICILM